MKKIFLLLLLSMAFANSTVVELTDKNFETKIKENNQTIVMFHAPWCGACKSMEPDYNKVSEGFTSKVKFASIDTEEQEKTSLNYSVSYLPTTILFENGKEVRREVGALSINEIKMFIDPIETIKKEHKKCMDGNTTSCMELADFYEEKEDYHKTIVYYNKACNQDEVEACTDLADLYYDGEKITKNYDKAKEYYEQACDGDDAYGCYSLGYMYEYGEGSLDVNKIKALKLYEKGCTFEWEDACEAITDLKNWDEYEDIFIVIFVVFFYLLFIVLHYRQKRVILVNKELNAKKEVPFLFSWTMFLFAFWVPLLRADFLWFVFSLIITVLTLGYGTMILAFFYNKMYIKDLLTSGYDPIDDESKALLDSKGIKYGFSKKSGADDEKVKTEGKNP